MRGLLGRSVLTFVVAVALGAGCGVHQPEPACSDCVQSVPGSIEKDPVPDTPPFFAAFGSAIVTSTDGIAWKARETLSRISKEWHMVTVASWHSAETMVVASP